MTKQELKAKREHIAQEYVQVVSRVLCAEDVIQNKGGRELLEKAKNLQGEERDKVCFQYLLLISHEIVGSMPDKDVENY